ncbi:hypothetical protein TNCT_83381 [Trichonephila clavata]|uniref:Uncharacterized protein n=1 Tax=Trichonephila clavata TaxID=2740835 RepID=A0A8X6ILN0_TRICU|nr:hypothetical protein TNCT_83381 [Trichonephila clavata]
MVLAPRGYHLEWCGANADTGKILDIEEIKMPVYAERHNPIIYKMFELCELLEYGGAVEFTAFRSTAMWYNEYDEMGIKDIQKTSKELTAEQTWRCGRNVGGGGCVN